MKSFLNFITEERVPGKKMGHDLYVHKDYADTHPNIPKDELEKAKSVLPKDHKYTAIKYNKKDKSFSFIHSPDFDKSDEPISGHAIKVHSDGRTTETKQKKDPQIWHHKWQWVGDDYKGFNVEKSKERSKHWRSVVGTDKAVSSRIGTKSYWDREVVPKL